jgi:putative membrane protein insertion efficiency factor
MSARRPFSSVRSGPRRCLGLSFVPAPAVGGAWLVPDPLGVPVVLGRRAGGSPGARYGLPPGGVQIGHGLASASLPPYDPRYDPRYDPYGRSRWGPGPGYGYRPGSSCLRDACLIETGCCLAESLDNTCLLASALLLPQFAQALSTAPACTSAAAGCRSAASIRVVAVVRVYQREVSAHRRPVCRFTPSCSEYAAQAVERHGALRGSLLAGRRLLRCRPRGPRGADPVRL